MDTVLQGINKTICYIDNILVTGSTVEEHLQNLESVLGRLQKYGIRAKRAKCSFMSEKVEYLDIAMTVRGCTSWPARWRLSAWHPSPETYRNSDPSWVYSTTMANFYLA